MVAIVFTLSDAKAQTYLDSIDFETGDFTQWREKCAGCGSDHNRLSPTIEFNIVHYGKFAGKYVIENTERTESGGVQHAIFDEEIWFGWSLYIPESWQNTWSGTLSQIHGGGPNFKTCGGGTFHLKTRSDHWGYWLRNAGPNTKDVYGIKPVRKGEWTTFIVRANMSKTNGYIYLTIKDSQGEQTFTVAASGKTIQDCSGAWFFKAGVYAGLPQGATIYVDEVRVARNASRKDVDPDIVNGSTNPTAVRQKFEVENMTFTSNRTVNTFADTNASNGTAHKVLSTRVNDFVEYTSPVVNAGTYSVKLGYKTAKDRGKCQLITAGKNIGTSLDQYAVTQAFKTVLLGNVTYNVTGAKRFKFVTTGKKCIQQFFQHGFGLYRTGASNEPSLFEY